MNKLPSVKFSKRHNNEKRFEALFEHATIGIVVVDNSGAITMLNSFAENLFGYTRNELTGKKIECLIPPEFTARHKDLREGFVAHPSSRAMGAGRDLLALRKSGSKFPVEISLSPYEADGELFVIAFIIDISVRKKDEEDLRMQRDKLEKYSLQITELNKQLERRVEERTLALRETLHQLERSRQELHQALQKERELSNLKSRFVSMASHEFRTPLSTILSSSSLISKYVKEEEFDKRERHVQRIKENVRNLTDILEDFLSLDKLEEGIVKPKFEDMNVPDFFNEIIGDFELKKENQRILYKHEGVKKFSTDKHLLKNVFINLLSNAVKFSEPDTSIDVQSFVKNNQFKFSVKDAGIGISEEDKEHLFDRFFRAKNASNIKGTGMGLHIVSKYLELLNGKIDYTSKLNQGTQFIVTITNN